MRARRRWRAVLTLVLSLALLGGIAAWTLLDFKLQDRINRGLDLAGGVRVVLQGVDKPGNPVTREKIDDAVEIIRNRVDALGVAEPVIQRQGEDRIVVELAGVKDPQAAIETIGRTARLEFRGPDGSVVVTGDQLVAGGIQVAADQAGRPVVQLQFNPQGTEKFAEATRKFLGSPISIVLDDQVISSPKVNDVITNGRAEITGIPTFEEAQRLAVALRYGALPVDLQVVENRTVSATLGADSLQRSVEALIVGGAAVAAFMLVIYRIPGFWAVTALAVYMLLTAGALYGLNATLTLPGIAGFVMSVGMAVDANVLIYERIKDELKAGKTIRAALDAGFRNAFSAILDSNLTTLIAAAVLYGLGTGPVRGFAVTLAVGVVASMFTAITLTRFFLRNLVDAELFRQPARLFGVRGEAR
ncbi:protein-export membrane protein SecD [Thermaerobacter marianensis DSM 12885]|uniref:Protein translocase subunit SecD n=1 Tax=Thermaerobacter marianensis (strain ATCC 700841 / DSM 12885 / JCM 10246 / 7p75a) TaxID=644966 RepID=E6SLR2_THEM7|nr:protein translocase subunit SecD [Thermaerobacter marianensis]ADU51361.1 protein-export membrane protein SecD [Thermaerobacter marianensis DSM 12885]